MAMRKTLCVLLASLLVCGLAAACSADKTPASSGARTTTANAGTTASEAPADPSDTADPSAGEDTGVVTDASGNASTDKTPTGSNTKKDPAATTKKPSGATKKPTTTTSRTAGTTYIAPGTLTDMKGYEFVIGSIWGNAWIPTDKSDANTKALSAKYAQVEKELNCKLSFKSLNVTTLLASVAKAYQAGDKFCDAMEIAPAYFYALVNNNYFLPVSDSKVINVNDSKWEKSAKAFSTYNNKIYGLSWQSIQFGVPARQVVFYNKTMWQNYGTGENLYDVVRKGNWTFDKMYEVLNTVVSKTNKKVTGMVAYDLMSAAEMFGMANGGLWVTEKNGKYSWTGNSNAIANGVSFTNKLYKQGLLVDRGDDDMISVVARNFMNGKIFMLPSDYYYCTRFYSSGMKDDYGILPIPKGPDAKGYMGIYSDSRFFCLMDTADRDKACKIFDVFANKTLNTEGWRKTALKKDLRDTDSADMIQICLDNPVIDILGQLSALKTNILQEPLTEAVTKGSVASKLASVEKQAQAYLNDQFKQ